MWESGCVRHVGGRNNSNVLSKPCSLCLKPGCHRCFPGHELNDANLLLALQGEEKDEEDMIVKHQRRRTLSVGQVQWCRATALNMQRRSHSLAPGSRMLSQVRNVVVVV